jgi:hypothetical protein
MQNGSRLLRMAGSLLLFCNLLCAGCSALIAYSGEDVRKLANKEQVHESFGTPTRYGNEQGRDFEEYHTRKKISEDQVAGGSIIADASTFGLLELVLFPYAVCHTAWTTLAGQTLLFEYAENGDVTGVCIHGATIDQQAQHYWSLPPW